MSDLGNDLVNIVEKAIIVNQRKKIFCTSCQRDHMFLEHFGVTEILKLLE